MLMLNIIAYFTASMIESNLFCPRTRTIRSVCATKATLLVMEVGIFYLEIFPNKMSLYVRLRCINQSTIRREISIKCKVSSCNFEFNIVKLRCIGVYKTGMYRIRFCS